MLIMTGVLILLAFFLGASLASFTAVAIECYPDEPITGRSHCICGRQLTASENIPVVGWLKARGRAKCCGAKIPTWYFVYELSAGTVFALATALALSSL